MIIGVTGSGHRGIESSEDQVPMDVRDVVQAPEYGPMTDLGHVQRGDQERYRGLECSKDMISTDVHDVVEAPKSNMMARGVALDLLQVAKRVGP